MWRQECARRCSKANVSACEVRGSVWVGVVTEDGLEMESGAGMKGA